MNQSKISVRYAKALFLLAKEKNALDEVYLNLKIVGKVVSESHELKSVLKNATILQSEKKELLNSVFADFNDIVKDFLNLLVDNDRQDYILNILRNFSFFYRKEKNLIHLTITTVEKISKILTDNIIKIFSEAYNSQIELEEKLDESIIGGIIFKIDNNELNMSVANQLSEIKNSLRSEVYKKKV